MHQRQLRQPCLWLSTSLLVLDAQALQAEWDGQKDAQPSKVVKKKKKKTLEEKMVPIPSSASSSNRPWCYFGSMHFGYTACSV